MTVAAEDMPGASTPPVRKIGARGPDDHSAERKPSPSREASASYSWAIATSFEAVNLPNRAASDTPEVAEEGGLQRGAKGLLGTSCTPTENTASKLEESFVVTTEEEVTSKFRLIVSVVNRSEVELYSRPLVPVAERNRSTLAQSRDRRHVLSVIPHYNSGYLFDKN